MTNPSCLAAARACATVDTAAIRANVEAVRRAAGADVAAVLKADAYGHGLVPAARAAIAGGAAWLGVASVAEAAELRHASISVPILLLCAPVPGQEVDALELDVTLTLCSAEAAAAVAAASSRTGRRAAVHLDIDTGMGRAGVLPADAVAAWRRAVDLGLDVEGVCTHFADADGELPGMYAAQIVGWKESLAALEAAGARFRWTHAANSAAILRGGDGVSNLVRPGLLTFGILPAGAALAKDVPELVPAMSLRAAVGTIRDLPAGAPISYGSTWRLERDSRTATVLLGYGDGYPRSLSNRGWMLVRGRAAPILGRVCMDQTVVDVTDIPDAAAGDEALAFGRSDGATLPVEEVARAANMAVHEITTSLSRRVPRHITGDEGVDE